MSAWEACVGGSDEYYTPAYVFEGLGCRFDLDVAAPPVPTKVPATRCITADSLTQPWDGFVWMNPPFGSRNALGPWLDKFFTHGNGLALTPDRTSAPWFRLAWSKADLVLFMPKVAFHRPDWSVADAPGTGTAIWAAGGRAMEAITRASTAGLGILAAPLNRHEATKVMTHKQRSKALASRELGREGAEQPAGTCLLTAADIEKVASNLYTQSTSNHPTIHSNRFPAWSELAEATREEWRQKARAFTTPKGPTDE